MGDHLLLLLSYGMIALLVVVFIFDVCLLVVDAVVAVVVVFVYNILIQTPLNKLPAQPPVDIVSLCLAL